MSQPTTSELTFEQYLAENGFTPIKIAACKTKQPDYRVELACHTIYCEVKELGRPKPMPTGGFSPLPYIQRKIKKAREKFDAYTDNPCCVVLFNQESIAATLDPATVLSAMFGKIIEGWGRQSFRFRGSAVIQPEINRTISAVVSLVPLCVHPTNLLQAHEISSTMRLLGRSLTNEEIRNISNRILFTISPEPTPAVYRAVVFHNPFALHPLPKEIFRSDFDEWWEKSSDDVVCTFRGTRLTQLWEAMPDYALTMMGLMFPLDPSLFTS